MIAMIFEPSATTRAMLNMQRACGISLRRGAIFTRHFSTGMRAWAPDAGEPAPPTAPHPIPTPLHSGGIAGRLAHVLKTYPQESVVSLVGLDILSIYGTYCAITLAGIDFSSEFAVAFALSRPFRRVRLPVDLAAAAALARLFPSLKQVKVAALFADALNLPGLPQPGDAAPKTWLARGYAQAAAVGSVINDYGAAYMFGSRAVGLVVVFGLYAGIRAGLDVNVVVESLGLSAVGNVLGTWAAAVVCASAIYPVTISCTALVAPALHALRLRFTKR